MRIENVEEAILKSARDTLKNARADLRKYRRYVNRENVRGIDATPWMGGIDFYYAVVPLWTLHDVSKSLGMARLCKILEGHFVRLERQFRALYETDRKRVNDAATAAREAELSEIHNRIKALIDPAPSA